MAPVRQGKWDEGAGFNDSRLKDLTREKEKRRKTQFCFFLPFSLSPV
jgi:hypothetical protein